MPSRSFMIAFLEENSQAEHRVFGGFWQSDHLDGTGTSAMNLTIAQWARSRRKDQLLFGVWW